MKADPKVSAGARLERQALRAYLRRKIRPGVQTLVSVESVLAYVIGRQQRYDKTPGGLGKR